MIECITIVEYELHSGIADEPFKVKIAVITEESIRWLPFKRRSKTFEVYDIQTPKERDNSIYYSRSGWILSNGDECDGNIFTAIDQYQQDERKRNYANIIKKVKDQTL